MINDNVGWEWEHGLEWRCAFLSAVVVVEKYLLKTLA
jgi:hypothetical protein